jgi:predicted phosphodiesterase
MTRNEKSKSLADRLAAVENQAEHKDAVKSRPKPPGWEPGVIWEGTKGSIVTDSLYETPSTWDDIMRSRGLDPDIYEIVGDSIRWCSYDGWRKDSPDDNAYSAICYSFKAEIRLKRSIEKHEIPEELYKEARKARKSSKPKPKGDETFLVALSDWQTGNRDGGGIARQAEAIADLVDSIPQRLADLRRAGHKIGTVAIAGLGDLMEGTCGHYPSQQFRIELDRREQLKIVRRGIRDIIMATAPHCENMIVTAVGGNHGENRGLQGKAFTTTGDNDDVAIFEQIAEILSVNPEAYGHVGFRLPLERLTVSLNLSGMNVAFTHGHLSKPSGNAAQSVWNWWKDQALGRAHAGVADAELLIVGHYHHLNVKEQEGRAVIVCPSLTSVGEYFQDAYGVRTRPGTLSLTIAPDGWGNLHLL